MSIEIADLEIAENGEALIVTEAEGRRRRLAATLLWAECPSARGRVRRARGMHTAPPVGLAITSVRGIGSYGVNVAFSDGHDRGIYPWSYLADLAGRPQLEDFLHD